MAVEFEPRGDKNSIEVLGETKREWSSKSRNAWCTLHLGTAFGSSKRNSFEHDFQGFLGAFGSAEYLFSQLS